MSRLKQFLPSKQETGIIATIALLIIAVFSLYLAFIGIPKTTARNLFNEAQEELENGELNNGLSLLREAYSAWPEGYVLDELMKLEALL